MKQNASCVFTKSVTRGSTTNSRDYRVVPCPLCRAEVSMEKVRSRIFFEKSKMESSNASSRSNASSKNNKSMAADNESMKKEASETAESLIKTDQRQLKIAQEAQRLVLDFVNETERLGFFNINIKTEIFGLISEGVKLTEAAEAAKAEAATEALAQVTVALAAQAIAKANMVQVEALENKAGKATRRAVAGTIEIARKVLQ